MATNKENTVENTFTKGERNQHNLYVGPKDPTTTLRNGTGHFTFSNTYFQYDGAYINNKKHGEGCLIMGNGTRIEGNFANDELTGPAHIYYANGDEYEGSLVAGEKSGYGEFKGMWYEYKGNWESNCRQGEGEFVDLCDNIRIVGNFHKHKPHGYCNITEQKNNTYYSGEMVMGVRLGKGDYESAKETFTGFWKDNTFNGLGHHYNRSTLLDYKGNFVDGKPDIFANELNAKVYKKEIQDESADQTPIIEDDDILERPQSS